MSELLTIEKINKDVGISFDKVDKDKESYYGNIVGFFNAKESKDLIDPYTDDVFLSIPSGEKKSSYGVYKSSNLLLEKNNICFAYDKKDKIFYIERKDVNGNTFLGVLDKDKSTFSSAQFDPKTKTLSPIKSQQDYNDTLISTLLNYESLKTTKLSVAASELREAYTLGSHNIIHPENLTSFAENLGLISHEMYDDFFNSKGSPLKISNQNIQSLDELKIPNATVVYGEGELSAFTGIDKDKRAGLINLSSAEGLYERYCENKTPEALERVKNFAYSPSEFIVPMLNQITDSIKINKQVSNDFSAEASAFYLMGPSGSGKTYDVEAVARILNKPFFALTCSQNLSSATLFEQTELTPDGSEIKPTKLAKTIIEGGVVLIDEANNVKNKDVFIKFNEALANGYFTVDGHKQQVNPETVFFFCGNFGHVGTVDLPTSVKDRATTILYSPMTAKQFQSIMSKHADVIFNSKRVHPLVSREDFDTGVSAVISAITDFNAKLYDTSSARAMSSANYLSARQLSGIRNAIFSFNPKISKDFAHHFYKVIADRESSPFSFSLDDELFQSFIETIGQQPYFEDASIDLRRKK